MGEIKYDVVVVHGIGTENGEKYGFSDKLKNLVVARCADAQTHWIEGPWEKLNDPIDKEIGALLNDLLEGYARETESKLLGRAPFIESPMKLPACFQRFEMLLRKGKTILNLLKTIVNVVLLRKAQDRLPAVLDALIDLPLYMAPKRAELVRNEVRKAFAKLPKDSQGIVLVGHSLGSVIAFDLFAEELAKAEGLEHCRIRKLVTFGSPLAWVTRIRECLAEQESYSKPKTCLGKGLWVNFYDKEDPVCERTKLDTGIFGDVENVSADSGKKFIAAHCAYWECPALADRIVELMKGCD